MAEFVIKLADERGRVQEQVQSAASAEELRQRFTQAGYYVYSVKAKGLTGGRKKAKLETFLIFNQQFLTLIKAGLPILGSLEMLSKSQKNSAFAGQLQNVAARVRTGESISAAFEAQGGFPLMYTTTLLAGERSGNLEEVLGRFLSFQRISLSFRKKLTASLIYPALLICLVFGLFVFLITFVVPRFATLYDQLGTNLPWLTLLLLKVGNDAQKYVLYVIPALALIVFLLFRWSKTDKGADRIDGIRIGMPVFGSIWIKYQVALFSRTLSTLLQGGLPLMPSLETAARSIASKRIAKAVFSSVGSIREGNGLATSLASTRVFPSLSIEMIEVGESTGALPQMLNSVAEFFEEDVQTALTAAMALIEPAILIVMGVVVVVILIALYLPIFSLGSAANLQH
ncbi:type II secretion system F family protein [Silvibacterium dinghuense]|uniref:Type II secretion system F family protein n=1 Tax=Silvibacterium dinghuense TaxID=1560006 RepID=A0A4Q1SBB3_9BACT|nr:type II secretion system F family protein [Silvibacterium dinghuense]RXS94406.1 type II secretion system F family protein [Silvibacterium dinghuense]GGH16322.1 type II secretion system protein [Silvibacterium dinghuense]